MLGADSERACAAAAPRCRTIMIPELKRIASASGFGSMLGLGGGPGERPRNSDGAGPSRPEDEDDGMVVMLKARVAHLEGQIARVLAESGAARRD